MLNQSEFRRFILLIIGGWLAMQATGCSRSFWRQDADKDTYSVMADKFTDERWHLPRVDVNADPRSRFYDFDDPDYAPLPPDDEAAHAFMYEMKGANGWRNLHHPTIKGWRGWHKFGQHFSVENPQWLEPFELKPEQLYSNNNSEEQAEPDSEISQIAYEDEEAQASVIADQPEERLVPTIEEMTLGQAIELANINSREYQTQIENLYLSALALTFDRFQFGVRFLGIGGGRPSASSTFISAPPGVNDRLSSNGRFGLGQLLPTGAQWAVEIANDTIWLFQGQGRSTTASALSYRITQPLLLGAGRKIVLEGLTQQERDVLYQTRTLARFRKILFTNIDTSFLGLIQESQTIDNQKTNIFRLVQQLNILRVESSQAPLNTTEELNQLPPNFKIPKSLEHKLSYNADLKLLIWNEEMSVEQERQLLTLSQDKEFLKAANEIVQRKRTIGGSLDVAVLESQLARSQNALKQSERSRQDSLDAFKIQLGLPPDFQVSIDKSMLKQFQLIDPKITDLEQRIDSFVTVWAQLENDSDAALFAKVLTGLSQFPEQIQQHGVDGIARDMKNVDQMIKTESANKNSSRDLQRLAVDVARDKRLYRSITNSRLPAANEELKSLVKQVAAGNLNVDAKKIIIIRIANLREELLKIVQGLQVIQIGQRVELVSLEKFRMPLSAATGFGIENRLDLLNSKAEVMDARRRIEIAANELESVLDLRVEGDIRTEPGGTKPFRFSSSQSSYRAGISFTAPLDQVLQRNNYRAALLDYQRAKRSYMSDEDDVKLSIRENWRQLQVLRENFEITRQSVRIAATQFDLAVDLSKDPKPGNSGGNQGLNLLNALASVLDAQNDFIRIWVGYERSRLNIHRDMGMMEVDPRGIWTDSYYMKITGNSVDGGDDSSSVPNTAVPLIPPPPAPAASDNNLRGDIQRVPKLRHVTRGKRSPK